MNCKFKRYVSLPSLGVPLCTPSSTAGFLRNGLLSTWPLITASKNRTNNIHFPSRRHEHTSLKISYHQLESSSKKGTHSDLVVPNNGGWMCLVTQIEFVVVCGWLRAGTCGTYYFTTASIRLTVFAMVCLFELVAQFQGKCRKIWPNNSHKRDFFRLWFSQGNGKHT